MIVCGRGGDKVRLTEIVNDGAFLEKGCVAEIRNGDGLVQQGWRVRPMESSLAQFDLVCCGLAKLGLDFGVRPFENGGRNPYKDI